MKPNTPTDIRHRALIDAVDSLRASIDAQSALVQANTASIAQLDGHIQILITKVSSVEGWSQSSRADIAAIRSKIALLPFAPVTGKLQVSAL